MLAQAKVPDRNTETMKKVISLFVAASVATVLLAGCGAPPAEGETNSGATATSAATPKVDEGAANTNAPADTNAAAPAAGEGEKKDGEHSKDDGHGH